MEKPNGGRPAPARSAVRSVIDRAQAGDETALPELRELLDKGGFVDLAGNLAQRAQEILVGKISGKNLLIQEATKRKLIALRAELAGATATPIERLLVERVVACWLHLHYLEAVYVGNDSLLLELAAHYQRCISAAHKRYLAAIKTLALVRKLAVPVLQVNIARQQTNIASAVSLPE